MPVFFIILAPTPPPPLGKFARLLSLLKFTFLGHKKLQNLQDRFDTKGQFISESPFGVFFISPLFRGQDRNLYTNFVVFLVNLKLKTPEEHFELSDL